MLICSIRVRNMPVNLESDVYIDDLIGIINQYGRQPGHFIQLLFDAWQIADPGNKPIIRDVVKKIILKYKLDEDYLTILKNNPAAFQASTDLLLSYNLPMQL
jgi:hypothetical protein